MKTDDFDYPLTPEHIAQVPVEPRDSCRLLVLHRDGAPLEHRHFSDLDDYLRAGDLLVVNETRVLPARIRGVRADTGGTVELLLLRELTDAATPDTWECLGKPAKRLRPGIDLDFGLLTARVTETGAEGLRTVQFTPQDSLTVRDALHRIGRMPLPPYIKSRASNPEQYQTVYATDEHSAAAPTAGLHFTGQMLDRLQAAGVRIARVRLDVGLDTFRPVTVDDPSEHRIHTEHYCVPADVVDAVNETRAVGGRVIAVGTTVVRSLESAARAGGGELIAADGATDLFILPGYRFAVVDALITNFHVPKSTLMMLVSAFAGRTRILDAYAAALAADYRFLSFGDAMLIL
ncbi:MAG: tRNA preQ1(34) S-adenosylmethionine ribosyltransferase-isomerase QueA [Actinomycetes bacterium]|jgi:S-adenosylmethionine:tRNA ribosyltransferase-isomerase|nr:tRNA preQ1(34) S-adenosylmethionine ribosyltransferase-isomerase QueA [Actinomycetes bacterium]